MHLGKRLKKGAGGKPVLLMAAAILLIVAVVGGTVAFIVTTSQTVTNTFELAAMPNQIIEDTSESGVKKDVAVQNTSEQNKAAYIRAAVVVTWAKVRKVETTTTDENGNETTIVTWEPVNEVHSTKPVEETDYTISFNLNEMVTVTDAETGTESEILNPDGVWKKGTDGYYYFTGRVAKDAQTGILITSCTQAETATVPECSDEGCKYVLSVEIVAQSIQADGENTEGSKPVILAWGTDNGGCVTGVADDGTLTIEEATT